ncbi:PREDICTED: RNA-binding motif protein, Y chromosome, family 1 member B-like isoform X2 [Nicotiana attenuata]|uniref:Glycine-rich rna-binding protein 8 n=1 Tax=Nicotiana attenuata TaxID=49451 RepID=A0A314KYW1_NICAT|nr:PREDICTED: RNA-binding motif protein, Y chromosome, family 1 member B-like isoform X2 [Nicotiana attenuata]OIT34671.1 glycine-rich rna-binding protein 8 [Nicotiana attenuata]
MALFCSPYNKSLTSISPSFTSSSIPKASAFNSPFPPIFSSERVSNFTPRISIDLSQKKPHLPKCSDSSVEPDNTANSTTIIFLKGLAKSTAEGRLKVVFSQFGDVSRVKIVTDKISKQPLGFAYIWFLDKESAQCAVQEMNGKFLDGRFIQVQMAKPGSCKPNVKTAPYKF